MNILFGLQLDGAKKPDAVATLGAPVCGPQALLALWELRLGLRSPPAPASRRVGEYRQLLQAAAATANRFYGRSLALDGLAVAEELLRWRDELVEAGWQAMPAVSARLNDLRAVEALVPGRLSPGHGDRLLAVERELAVRPPHGERIQVWESAAELPLLWQKVLTQFGAEFGVGARLSAGWTAALTASTDLTRLRSALSLAGATSGGACERLRGDASVQLWQAYSEVSLARGVAQEVKRCLAAGQSVAVLAEDTAGQLETAFQAEGLPALGLQPRSSARPIPQLLGMALSLLWEPLDPRALLGFLTHPVSPVPGVLRRRLARVLAEAPGVGGRRWQEAIAEAHEEVRGRHADRPEEQARESDRLKVAVKDWLEMARFPEPEGVEAIAVQQLCHRLARWGFARAELPELAAAVAAQFRALANGAKEVAELLGGTDRIHRCELERIVQQVMDTGVPGAATVAGLGTAWQATSPAALLGQFDVVVWWDWREPGQPPRPPWTAAERAELLAQGMRLLTGAHQQAREHQAWNTMLAAAGNRLLLACPRTKGGKPSRPHPLRARLQALLAPGVRLPTVDVDLELRRATGDAAGAARPQGSAAARRPLPQPQRWWKLPSGLSPRAEESYSSLEKFIYSPYQWVLTYPARLKAGPLSEIRLADGSRQAGSLLDQLLDQLLASPAVDWRTCADDDLETWLGQVWPGLLRQEAANLLLPGHRAEAATLRETASRSLRELLRLLRASGVGQAEAHTQLPAIQFEGVRLGGTLDLKVVKHGTGEVGILDLKLGGRETREKELKENRALQLAIYGQLVRSTAAAAAGAPWPATGFFILREQRLLTTHPTFWDGGPTVRPRAATGGESVCWQDFLEVWRWRRDQLAAGWVELTLPDTEHFISPPEAPDSVPPQPHWSAGDGHSKFSPFGTLTGWSPNA